VFIKVEITNIAYELGNKDLYFEEPMMFSPSEKEQEECE
jgi:hypothetical protein